METLSLVLWHVNSVTDFTQYSGCPAEGFFMGADLGEQCSEVHAAELPLEGASGGVVVSVEAQEAI